MEGLKMFKRITKNPEIGEEIRFKKISYFSQFLNLAIALNTVVLSIIIFLILTL